MSDTLIIHFLDRTGTFVEWAHLDSHNHKVAGSTKANLADVIPPLAQYSAFVFVPSTDILLTTVDIPYTTQARLLKAIPYALEEQLAEEVEDLHFALVHTLDHQPPHAVAVVKDELMISWLQLLEHVKIVPEVIAPDVFAIPYSENAWTIFIEDHVALIRQDYTHGFATDAANVNQEIGFALLEIEKKPERLVLLSKQEQNIELNLETLAIHGLKVNKENTNISFMELAIAAVNDIIPINLLQGSYRGKHRYLQISQRWKWPLILGSAWLLTFIIGHIIGAFYLKQRDNTLQQQVISLYQRIYPEAKPTQPQRELERQISKLNRIAQGSRFVILIGKTGDALHTLNITKIEQFSFNENELTLKISLEDSAALENLTRMLTQQGLKVKRNEVTSKGKNVSADLGIS